MKKIIILLSILTLTLSISKGLIEDIKDSKPEIRRKNWIFDQIKKTNEDKKRRIEEKNYPKLRRLNEIEAVSNTTPKKKTSKTMKTTTTKKKVIKKKTTKKIKKKTTTKNIKKVVKKTTTPTTNKKSSTMKKSTTKK